MILQGYFFGFLPVCNPCLRNFVFIIELLVEPQYVLKILSLVVQYLVQCKFVHSKSLSLPLVWILGILRALASIILFEPITPVIS